jgi:hypothetical protein
VRLEREFDPEAVRDLKAQLPYDRSVGGPTLAAHAIRTGLGDKIQLLVVPISAEGGTESNERAHRQVLQCGQDAP